MLLAELPSPSWLPIVAVALAVFVIGGMGIILAFLQNLRKNAATEIKREIAADDEPTPMRVQQPLIIKAEVEYATKAAHEALRQDFSEFRIEVRDAFNTSAVAASKSREKIYNALNDQAKLLAANTTETELTRQRLEKLDTKIDRVLEWKASQ